MKIPNALKTRVTALEAKLSEALALIPDLDTLSIDMEKSGLSVAEVRAVGQLVDRLNEIRNLTRATQVSAQALKEAITVL